MKYLRLSKEKVAKLSKKDHERFQLEKFVSNEGLKIPVTDIVNSETPDFIVKSVKKTFSVELTQLINPDLKQKESFRNTIVKQAEEMFLEKYNDDLRVFVTFSNQPIKCSASDSINLSIEIFEIVERLYLANRGFEFRVSSRRKSRPFNWFIDTIFISNEISFSSWQPFGAYKVDRIEENWLKSVIESKGKNVCRYQQSFEENWLVLVSSLGSKSSTYDVEFLQYEPIATPFNRIFIYKWMEDKIIELPSK